MYILRPNNYKEEVYDMVISHDIATKHTVVRKIKHPLTIDSIRQQLDPNEHSTLVIGKRLYIQSGLVNIESIV